ncbi:MAG: hypothetical protein AAF725_09825 [Acidobacteriota bacterium]
MLQNLSSAKDKLNELDIDSLSDEELEDVAGGDWSLWCCNNNNGGDSGNGDGGDGGDGYNGGDQGVEVGPQIGGG